jgi:hypothetical protein
MSSQKPLVIYPHLPKLMEAVVKSLDPNSTSNRDAVLDTATEIIGHVVKTCVPQASSPTDVSILLADPPHPAQFSHYRLSHGKPTSRHGDGRGCDRDVRPQDGYALVCARVPQAGTRGVQFLTRWPAPCDGVPSGRNGTGVEGRHWLHEFLLPRCSA